MSNIEFSHTNKNGEIFSISGNGAEVKEIAKLVLEENKPLSIGRIQLGFSPFKGFDFFETKEKVIKSKAIIKKVNEFTIEIEGNKLSLNKNRVPGTDYKVYRDNKDGSFFIGNPKETYCIEPIGGFHYGLIPEDFQARNNITQKEAKKIRGINAYSIWDKKHRPNCNPEGMVFIPKLNIWVDIYLLNSDHRDIGTSSANKSIAGGTELYGRKIPYGEKDLKGKVINAIAKYHKKRLLTKDEFQIITNGVKENDSARDLDDGITKHIPDFISKNGIEQATGVQWVWTSTSFGKSEDDEDNRYIVGGSRGSGCDASSRSAHWNDFGWVSSWNYGCRFACDSLKLDEVSESEQ